MNDEDTQKVIKENMDKTENDDEKDYPVVYTNAQEISNAEDWLEGRTVEEIKKELNTLHSYQIEWMGYITDDKSKKTLLRNELEERDYRASMYGTPTNPTQEEDEEEEEEIVWDSGLEIIDNFKDLAEHEMGVTTVEQYALQELGIQKNKVLIPEEVRKICVAVQNKVNKDYGGGCEFGILFKGEWTDNGFLVKPDYVIPEQKASRAHITYKEDLKKYRDEGYIVNIHSHPWAGESSGFSGTDDEHINSHFDMAVLFAGGAETLVDAVANVEVEEGVEARISPEVVVESPDEDLPDVNGLENVSTRTKKRKTTKTRGHGHGYYNQTRYDAHVKDDEEDNPKASSERYVNAP